MTEDHIKRIISQAADELAEMQNSECLDDNHYGFVESLVRRIVRESESTAA